MNLKCQSDFRVVIAIVTIDFRVVAQEYLPSGTNSSGRKVSSRTLIRIPASAPPGGAFSISAVAFVKSASFYTTSIANFKKVKVNSEEIPYQRLLESHDTLNPLFTRLT